VTLDELEVIDSLGQRVVLCPREKWHDVAVELLAGGYEMLADLTAVDYLDHWQGHDHRYEVVANVLSISKNERLRVRVPVDEDDCTCPSVTDVWPGANFMEREAFDMFGVVFTEHPELDRILMPEDWEGYPLRKDYGVGAIPVQFQDAGGPGGVAEPPTKVTIAPRRVEP